jgi:hypothetical protein
MEGECSRLIIFRSFSTLHRFMYAYTGLLPHGGHVDGGFVASRVLSPPEAGCSLVLGIEVDSTKRQTKHRFQEPWRKLLTLVHRNQCHQGKNPYFHSRRTWGEGPE